MKTIPPNRIEELENRVQELETINNELMYFNYACGHDFKEPLRKIRIFATLVIDDEKSTISQEATLYLKRIIVSTERLQRLCGDLLLYFKINIENDLLTEVDFNCVFRDVEEELRDYIEVNGAQVTAAKLPVTKAIEGMMHQLIYNIMINSIKYKRNDCSPVINVTYDKDSANKLHIITINDNGIGVPEDQREKIFEPFVRLHSKDRYDGNGLGLAICHKIMTKHKGRITAESSDGGGTAIRLFFPFNNL